MINLTEKPFYLNEEQIKWVANTFASLNEDEKIGQLFILLKSIPGVNEDAIAKTVAMSHQGGLRWQNAKDASETYLQNMTYQKYSKVPLLIAANCDDGGNGAVPEGTFVATQAECGAGEGTENAYHLGLVSGREAMAVGANWMFNPVCDVYLNWRNTIVNTRSFGCDPDRVLADCRAYIKGIKDADPNMAVTAKHFPGDGVDELDQHLVMGVNSLSVTEWNNTFGKVYKGLIEDGTEAVMVGHIALPEMSRKLRPGIKDDEIMPATLAPELLNDLLRESLGFNGLIVTDASHMMGMAAVKERAKALPMAVEAGCDMLLFANDVQEDMGFVKAGIAEGILSQQRLDDAVLRILALKAHLHLYEEEVRCPSDKLKNQLIGTAEHKHYTEQAADTCITLVKDTKKILPLDPEKKKRCYLIYVGSTPNTRAWNGDAAKKTVIEEMQKAGYDVDACPSFYELEAANGVSFMNAVNMFVHITRREFKEKYDFAMIVVNIKGYAQTNEERIRWSCGHSQELPWYNEEIPTIAVSLNYTNHLIDIPQVHTYINAYAPNRENIQALVRKISGVSAFKGHADDNVFCGRFETRI